MKKRNKPVNTLGAPETPKVFQMPLTAAPWPGSVVSIRRIKNGFLMKYPDGRGSAEVFVRSPKDALGTLAAAMEALPRA